AIEVREQLSTNHKTASQRRSDNNILNDASANSSRLLDSRQPFPPRCPCGGSDRIISASTSSCRSAPHSHSNPPLRKQRTHRSHRRLFSTFMESPPPRVRGVCIFVAARRIDIDSTAS